MPKEAVRVGPSVLANIAITPIAMLFGGRPLVPANPSILATSSATALRFGWLERKESNPTNGAVMSSFSTGNVAWPQGARAAVSLTYDGARESHLDVARVDLATYGLRGTFYLDAARALGRVACWCELVGQGHELGNGCLLEAADAQGRLGLWTREMVFGEMDSVREFLESDLRAGEHSFGFPWGAPRCASNADYRDVIEGAGYLARSGVEGYNASSSCALSYLKMIPATCLSAEEIVSLAEVGVRSGAWLIFAFRDLAETAEATSPRAHHALARWLWELNEDVWTAPVTIVARHVRRTRQRAAQHA